MKKITIDGIEYALIPIKDNELLDVFEVGSYLGKKFYYTKSEGNPRPVYTVTGVVANGKDFNISWYSPKSIGKATIGIRELKGGLKSGRIIEVKEEVKKEKDWDGVTFKCNNNPQIFTIKKNTDGLYVINFKTLKGIWGRWSSSGIERNFENGSWKEVKKVATLPDENDVMIDIYEGDIVWFEISNYITGTITTDSSWFGKDIKYFATKAAAEKELERTKKKYSEEDITKAFNYLFNFSGNILINFLNRQK